MGEKNPLVTPVLKWVGGKRRLLDAYEPLFPKEFNAYHEPFVGGGAVLFHLQPKVAFINDINEDLINVYAVIRDKVDELVHELRSLPNEKDFYYAIRNQDRDAENYAKQSDVVKAARILYLIKVCYNGLYRVNKKGQFNVAFGRYKNPDIVNEKALRAVSEYLNTADVRIFSGDFGRALEAAQYGDFIYLDPPYDSTEDAKSYTSYTIDGFSRLDQIRLRDYCDILDALGAKFMVSNYESDFIRDLYSNYNITPIQARHIISCNANKRRIAKEVVVRNYA